MTYPIGSLQRALADRARALADGTHVDARDLGARTNPHNVSGRPYVVVTPELRWAMDWAPRSPEESLAHSALDLAEPDMIARQANEADALAAESGDDWDDHDTAPANDPEYWAEIEAGEQAETALLARVALLKAAGTTARHPGVPYHVHNPFSGQQLCFERFADASAYARAASEADQLDGDLGVWSASGPGEYALFKGGSAHAEG